MLRVSMARALSRIKLEPRMLTWIRGHSSKGGPGAEEELEEAAGRVMVKFEDLPKRQDSERLAAFRKKMKEDMAAAELNSQGESTDARYHKLAYNSIRPQEDDPLPPWPNNTNPETGEVGGPKGPEPTRYGDWERKGVCVDF